MKLCVALDLADKDDILSLVRQLKSFDSLWFKVGLRSFIRDGLSFLDSIKSINPYFHLFLDLKIYDIPNTMLDAVHEVTKLKQVDLLTIHASSGFEGMKSVMDSLRPISHRPLIFAVSVLTTFNGKDLEEVYGTNDVPSKVEQMALLAQKSGVDGVVCSVHESLRIKTLTQNTLQTLTPGIRPFREEAYDQKRVSDIQGAKDAKSDFIVIGRPIYKNKNPQQIVERIYQEMFA